MMDPSLKLTQQVTELKEQLSEVENDWQRLMLESKLAAVLPVARADARVYQVLFKLNEILNEEPLANEDINGQKALVAKISGLYQIIFNNITAATFARLSEIVNDKDKLERIKQLLFPLSFTLDVNQVDLALTEQERERVRVLQSQTSVKATGNGDLELSHPAKKEFEVTDSQSKQMQYLLLGATQATNQISQQVSDRVWYSNFVILSLYSISNGINTNFAYDDLFTDKGENPLWVLPNALFIPSVINGVICAFIANVAFSWTLPQLFALFFQGKYVDALQQHWFVRTVATPLVGVVAYSLANYSYSALLRLWLNGANPETLTIPEKLIAFNVIGLPVFFTYGLTFFSGVCDVVTRILGAIINLCCGKSCLSGNIDWPTSILAGVLSIATIEGGFAQTMLTYVHGRSETGIFSSLCQDGDQACMDDTSLAFAIVTFMVFTPLYYLAAKFSAERLVPWLKSKLTKQGDYFQQHDQVSHVDTFHTVAANLEKQSGIEVSGCFQACFGETVAAIIGWVYHVVKEFGLYWSLFTNAFGNVLQDISGLREGKATYPWLSEWFAMGSFIRSALTCMVFLNKARVYSKKVENTVGNNLSGFNARLEVKDTVGDTGVTNGHGLFLPKLTSADAALAKPDPSRWERATACFRPGSGVAV